MIRRLLLWDIDGTLVHAGGMGGQVFDDALIAAYGDLREIRIVMSGKTDPQIVREYLEALGVPAEAATVAALLEAAERGLAAGVDRMKVRGHTYPGVPELLERLAGDERIINSVLTGNTVANAKLKLATFGLDRWLDLDVGAYGSDDADRTRLVEVALGRGRERYGSAGSPLTPGDAWVIGDTPLDLACARAGGARCLLVGTGRYPASELGALGAEAVVENLADADAVAKLLTGDL